MFNRMRLINVVMTLAMAISAQAITINNKNNVPLFEKNPGEKIYELTGMARGTTTKHSVALIEFSKGAASVPHFHPVIEESYYVVSGEGTIIVGEEKAVIKQGDLVVIPQNVVHQVINNSDQELKLIVTAAEAWTPDCMVFPNN